MNNAMKHVKGLLLGFAFRSPDNAFQLFEDGVRKRGHEAGGEDRPIRAKVRNTREGALDATTNMGRHNL